MAKEKKMCRSVESDKRVRSLFTWATTGPLIFLVGIIARAPNKESHLLVSQLAATCQFGFVKAAVLINSQDTDWS